MIELKNVTAVYQTNQVKTTALRNLSLEIKEDSLTSIMGKSGSGKTTLLKVIGALMKPIEGNVLVDGIDLYSMAEKKLCEFRRQKVGFIYQSYDLLPELTAYENIALATMINNKKPERKAILDLCALIEIDSLLDKYPTQLSGGEQQRVAIARAVSTNPHILLCDEPTGNLDEETANRIMDCICEVQKSKKITAILVTHDLDMAKRAGEIIRIKDGKVI